uniref:Uncharacterized protein n=1 Tax=Magnetococcus massalia (strain MO-1) TaxID=451514 RepID=A0A1S7LLG1_MAGMO|nr:Protein of unknown function [Candidatus Magnetococcus massalia]
MSHPAPPHARLLPRHTLRWLVVALLICLFTAQLINQFARHQLPVPYMGLMSDQFATFEQHRERVETLFLGASRFYHGLDPITFDETAQRAGCQSYSYNFSLTAMTPIEMGSILKQLAQKPLPKLKRVVIGYPAANRHMMKNQISNRNRYFNTWSNLWPHLRDIAVAPEVNSKQLAWLGSFLKAFIYEQFAIGRLSTAAFPLTAKAVQSELPSDHRRGFYSPKTIDDPTLGSHGRKRWQGIHHKPEQYPRQIAAAERYLSNQSVAHRRWKGDGKWARIHPVVEQVERLGLEPIVLFTPSLSTYIHTAATVDGAQRWREALPVLNYNQVTRYPKLFLTQERMDWSHSNWYGAQRFSKQLGQDLCGTLLPK